MGSMIASMFIPQSTEELVHAYLLWLAVFFVVNVVWDMMSSVTPKFHFLKLKSKTEVVLGSTSFCSSALLIGSLLNQQTATVVGGAPVPTVIAGAVGVIMSLSTLCPYSENDIGT